MKTDNENRWILIRSLSVFYSVLCLSLSITVSSVSVSLLSHLHVCSLPDGQPSTSDCGTAGPRPALRSSLMSQLAVVS